MSLSVIGIWLLVSSFVLIVLEGAVAGIWTARLARRSKQMSSQLATEQRLLQADIEKLHEALAETQVLWQPYRRLLRFLRHPIVIALMQSFARRRRAA
jgi:K+-sensing histidine kinase KdpD